MENVREIVECGNFVDANSYLKLGWVLIRVFSSNVSARYILGWKRTENAKHPEKLLVQAQLEYLDSEIEKQKKIGYPESK